MLGLKFSVLFDNFLFYKNLNQETERLSDIAFYAITVLFTYISK